MNARRLLELDQAAFAPVRSFEAIELSPVLHLEVENPAGGWLPLERLLTSGFGSELAPKLFVPV